MFRQKYAGKPAWQELSPRMVAADPLPGFAHPPVPEGSEILSRCCEGGLILSLHSSGASSRKPAARWSAFLAASLCSPPSSRCAWEKSRCQELADGAPCRAAPAPPPAGERPQLGCKDRRPRGPAPPAADSRPGRAE